MDHEDVNVAQEAKTTGIIAYMYITGIKERFLATIFSSPKAPVCSNTIKIIHIDKMSITERSKNQPRSGSIQKKEFIERFIYTQAKKINDNTKYLI